MIKAAPFLHFQICHINTPCLNELKWQVLKSICKGDKAHTCWATGQSHKNLWLSLRALLWWILNYYSIGVEILHVKDHGYTIIPWLIQEVHLFFLSSAWNRFNSLLFSTDGQWYSGSLTPLHAPQLIYPFKHKSSTPRLGDSQKMTLLGHSPKIRILNPSNQPD